MKKIVKLFEHGNVSVSGERGSGKDMLMSNVAVRRKKPYLSNINYDTKKQKKTNNGKWIDLDFNELNIPVTHSQLIEGEYPYYEFPYPDGTDVYISDASVLFPNYATLELNKKYHGLVVFSALDRQLGQCNVHINSQNIGRVWEKLPEQCFTFIQCIDCVVLFGIVFQIIRIYEKRESCEAHIPPMPRMRTGLTRKSNFDRQAYELQRLAYQAKYGVIQQCFLIYRNKSDYDTRRYKKLFSAGKKHFEKGVTNDENFREVKIQI